MPKSPAKSYPSKTVEAGDLVYRRGDVGHCMYLIQSGSVEVREARVPGAPRESTVLERGDFFGEMAVLGEDVRTHEVCARVETRLVEIDGRRFSSLLKRNAEITIRMIRKLARRIASHEEILFEVWSAQGAEAQGAEAQGAEAQGAEAQGAGRQVEAGSHLDGDATLDTMPRAARLVHLDSEDESVRFELPPKDEISIGRVDPLNEVNPDIDLTDLDSQLSTSRRHAQILRRGATVLIAEVRSTNGTFVDGRRLDAESPVVLRGGEEIRFGGVRMRFVFEPSGNRAPRPAVSSGTARAPAGGAPESTPHAKA